MSRDSTGTVATVKAQGYPRRRPLPFYQARAGAAVDNPYSARAVEFV